MSPPAFPEAGFSQERRKSPPPIPESIREESRDRAALLQILSSKGISADAVLELVAGYRPYREDKGRTIQNEFKSFALHYGLIEGALSPDDERELCILYAGLKHARQQENKRVSEEVISLAIHDRLVNCATNRIDALYAAMTKSESLEDLRLRLIQIMQTMQLLGKRVPPDRPEHKEVWQGLYLRFRKLVSAKVMSSRRAEVSQLFQEIFDEFATFIDDEFVSREVEARTEQQRSFAWENLVNEVYGRTAEEVYALKARNRKKVAREMLQMKNEGIGIQQLEHLHAVNNQGLVPRSISRLRESPVPISFGLRVGVAGEDVAVETGDVLMRADAIAAAFQAGELPRPLYEIMVAALHNDLLDIHPFADRNGSTSLLFIELMMTKAGYVPSEEREPSYYKHLETALNHNLVAVGVVKQEQRRIAYELGHYEGKTTAAKKAYYNNMMFWIARANDKMKDFYEKVKDLKESDGMQT